LRERQAEAALDYDVRGREGVAAERAVSLRTLLSMSWGASARLE
jgi:hypothetical protein